MSEIEGKPLRLEDSLNKLPARIAQIRKMNYRALANLESDQTALVERWASIGPGLKEIIRSGVSSLRPEISILESEISQRRMDTVYNTMRLTNLEIRLSTLQLRLSDLSAHVSKSLGDIEGKLQSVEQDVALAEGTLNLISQASFQWKEKEFPIYAVNGKDMNRDAEGVITLTNLRFLFESEKEVVLKKRLFIATEKKKVRETLLDQPVGIIDSVTKGRVGLLAGAGLFITFKPQSGLQEMKFDVKGHEADSVIRFYNYIVSGQADAEASSVEGPPPPPTDEKPKITVCPRCGAPFTEEIYRGQTSVQCRYCGAVIPLTQ